MLEGSLGGEGLGEGGAGGLLGLSGDESTSHLDLRTRRGKNGNTVGYIVFVGLVIGFEISPVEATDHR